MWSSLFFFPPYIWNVVHFRVSVFRVLEKKRREPPSLFFFFFPSFRHCSKRERESESERSAFPVFVALKSLKAILLDDDREEDQEETKKKKKTESCFLLFSNLFSSLCCCCCCCYVFVRGESTSRKLFDVLLSS